MYVSLLSFFSLLLQIVQQASRSQTRKEVLTLCPSNTEQDQRISEGLLSSSALSASLSKKTLCTCSDQTSPTGPKGNCLRSTLWGHGNTSSSGWPNPLPPTLCLRIRKFHLVFQQFEQLVEPKESAACRITSQLIDSNCKFESSVSNLTKTTREKIRSSASKTCSLSTSKKRKEQPNGHLHTYPNFLSFKAYYMQQIWRSTTTHTLESKSQLVNSKSSTVWKTKDCTKTRAETKTCYVSKSWHLLKGYNQQQLGNNLCERNLHLLCFQNLATCERLLPEARDNPCEEFTRLG